MGRGMSSTSSICLVVVLPLVGGGWLWGVYTTYPHSEFWAYREALSFAEWQIKSVQNLQLHKIGPINLLARICDFHE